MGSAPGMFMTPSLKTWKNLKGLENTWRDLEGLKKTWKDMWGVSTFFIKYGLIIEKNFLIICFFLLP